MDDDTADRITVLTGAGISTESRIPDFRGPNAMWTRDPSKMRMVTIEAEVRPRSVQRCSPSSTNRD